MTKPDRSPDDAGPRLPRRRSLLRKLVVLMGLVVVLGAGVSAWLYYQEHGELIGMDREKTVQFLTARSADARRQMRQGTQVLREKARQSTQVLREKARQGTQVLREKARQGLESASAALVEARGALRDQEQELEAWFQSQKASLPTWRELEARAGEYARSFSQFGQTERRGASREAREPQQRPPPTIDWQARAEQRRRKAEEAQRAQRQRELEEKLTADVLRHEEDLLRRAREVEERPGLTAAARPAVEPGTAATGAERQAEAAPLSPAVQDPKPTATVSTKPPESETRRPPVSREEAPLRRGREAFRRGIEHWRAAGEPGSPDQQKELAIARKHFTEAQALLAKAREQEPTSVEIEKLQVDCNRFLYDCIKRITLDLAP